MKLNCTIAPFWLLRLFAPFFAPFLSALLKAQLCDILITQPLKLPAATGGISAFLGSARCCRLFHCPRQGVGNVNVLLATSVRYDFNLGSVLVNDHSCNLSVVKSWRRALLQEIGAGIISGSDQSQTGCTNLPSVFDKTLQDPTHALKNPLFKV